MARRPDVQYIQMYNYGSTARKLDLRTYPQKQKYQLPEQVRKPQQVQKPMFDVLSLCAIAVAVVMLLAMAVGMLRVGELSRRRRELEDHIALLQEQQADLKKTYEATWDLPQTEERARQMGMIKAQEATRVSMGKLELPANTEPSFGFREFWAELFAKAQK